MSKEFLVVVKLETIKEYRHTNGKIYFNENNGKYYYHLNGCCCGNHRGLGINHMTGPYDTYVQAQLAMDSHYEHDYIPF